MHLDRAKKEFIKQRIADLIKDNDEIEKIIVFGSFNYSDNPNDIDIAVIENTQKDYLTLALKYRKQLREITSYISIDVIPLKNGLEACSFYPEIQNGEVIYERRIQSLA